MAERRCREANDNYSSGAAGGIPRQRKYVACVVVILAIGVSLGSYTFSFYRKVAICQELEDTIESMAQTPPEDFDARAWGVIVTWTANLHVNSHAYSADTDEVARLLSELKRKVDKEPPDLEMIEWIWSEYAI